VKGGDVEQDGEGEEGARVVQAGWGVTELRECVWKEVVARMWLVVGKIQQGDWSDDIDML
jgi:hypothetical protein